MTEHEPEVLRRRMRHLEVEYRGGVAHGTVVKPAWASAAIAPFALTATAARLRALADAGRPEAEALIAEIPDEVVRDRMRGTLAMPDAPRRAAPVTVWFAEALVGREAPIEQRVAQWIRRLVYLAREEGVTGELRLLLLISWAMLDLLHPGHPSALAFLLHEVPRRPPGPERDAVLYALQCCVQLGRQLDLREPDVVRAAADYLEMLPFLADGVPPDILRELVQTGVLSTRFDPDA